VSVLGQTDASEQRGSDAMATTVTERPPTRAADLSAAEWLDR
jgi:hypothetical protein